MIVKFAKRAAVVAGATTLAAVMVAGTAQADPTEFRELNGVGSDTTQDVLNGLSGKIVDPNNSPAHLLIASYDAVNPTTGAAHECIVLRTGRTCPTGGGITRPNGSGEGIAALNADIASGAGNIDFARSSSGVSVAGTNLTWVPFAEDAVTLAVKTGSTLKTNVTFAPTNSDLKRVYNCLDASGNPLPAGQFPTINDASGNPVTVHPLVPQTGSGTRKFWAQKLGFDPVNLPSCVSDHAKNGAQVEEHDGSGLQRTVAADGAEDIVPFSIAQWIAQSNSTTTKVRDRRNGAVLESVDSASPTTGSPAVLNTAFPINRDVYNVIKTTRLTETDIALAFVGATSKVCTNTATIQLYGFGLLTHCGDTTLTGNS
ncbi:hypothetical protein [Streptomyces sp. NPDC021224]|uniref:hypothetical protein n=1 Tax=unclassified Streptomyces TaxID=2593676 RepID=UPI00379E3697